MRIERLPLRRRAPWLSDWLYRTRMRLFPRDLLTGVYNRVAFTERVQAALAAGQAGALLMVDVDRFSWINYHWGHVKGDECLRHLAGLLCDTGAGRNLVGRLSGEEFVVYTALGSQAEGLAEQIRSRIEHDAKLEDMRAPVPRRPHPNATEHGCHGPLLTVTIGVARASPGTSFEELLHASYEAQTAGKAAGSNRVVVG